MGATLDSAGADPAAIPALAFEGAAECSVLRGGRWRLRGRARALAANSAGRDSAHPVELLLSGVRLAQAVPPPGTLHELCVHASAPRGGAHALQLQAREGTLQLQAQAVRLHRDAAREFYRALPRTRVPLLTRAGWAALLTLLRVPLVARWLNRPAGSAGSHA